MWSLVTGASSGIGRDMARYLYKKYNSNLILVSRNEKELNELKQELESNETNKNGKLLKQENKFSEKNNNKFEKEAFKKQIIIIPADLSKKDKCIEIYEKIKEIEIDLLINNAGFGVFGEFSRNRFGKRN